MLKGCIFGWLVVRLVGWSQRRAETNVTMAFEDAQVILHLSRKKKYLLHIWDISKSYLGDICDINVTYLEHIWKISEKISMTYLTHIMGIS